MSDLLARVSAVAVVITAAIAVLVLVMTSSAGVRGTTVKAEFQDAFPLLPGMNVRVSGGIAGTVKGIELTDQGTSLVTMVLNDGTTPPSSDASAAVRQQDITGDSYVSLSLGDSGEPLGDTVISDKRTLVAPRFDDLLNSFDSPTRSGLKLILVELGTALERNGDDLNEAVLRLRPGFEAANEAIGQVASQNQALRQLIDSAEDVTGQAASRTSELEGLIDSLLATLQETEEHAGALDRAVEQAPPTVREAHTTLTRLTRLATSAEPLARSLSEGAPQLAQSLELLDPFLEDSSATLLDLEPTLELTEQALIAAEPTLEVGGKRLATAPFDLAGGLGDLFKYLLGSEQTLKALFGGDSYGSGPSLADDVGFSSVATELGNQIGYEEQDPNRRFMRAVAVVSCETFGLPIQPGCLAEAVNATGAGAAQANRDREGGNGGIAAGAPGSEQHEVPPPQTEDEPAQPDPGQPDEPSEPETQPDLPLPELPDLPGDEQRPGGGLGGVLDQLLDFLLGP